MYVYMYSSSLQHTHTVYTYIHTYIQGGGEGVSAHVPVERHVVNGSECEDGDEEEDHQLQRRGDAVRQEVADAVEDAPRYQDACTHTHTHTYIDVTLSEKRVNARTVDDGGQARLG